MDFFRERLLSRNILRIIPVLNRVIQRCSGICFPAIFMGVLFSLPPAAAAAAQEISASEASKTDASAADAGRIVVTKLTMGFNGVGRVGNWLPVHLTATGFAPATEVTLVITASDPRGDQCESVIAKVASDSQGKASVDGVFITGRLEGAIRLRLETPAGEILWQHSVACVSRDSQKRGAMEDSTNAEQVPETPAVLTQMTLHRHQSLTLLTIGAPAGLSELADRLAASNKSRDVLTLMSVKSTADLPSTRRGFDSVDTLLLVTDYGLTTDQTKAVQDWVLMGGQLLVSCGANLPQLLVSPMGEWLTPEFGIQQQLLQTQDLTALQNYVSGASQLQTNRQPVPVVRVSSEQPRILVDSINGPLVSRLSKGAGIVTMVMVDLNQRPLNRWLSLSQLYEVLLFDRILDTSGEQSSRGGKISSTGVTDLSTQLASVSDAIPSDERWSSWHAMLLMLGYLIVIGPIDYLVVVHLLKRPRLTWVTFPVLVALSCSLPLWWSTTQRSAATLREVNLLDVGQNGTLQTARSRTWSSLSTSDSRFASVTSAPEPVFAESGSVTALQTLVWHGRAEDVYGGLYREGGAGLGQQTSRRTELDGGGYSSIPLMVDGSQAFLAETVSESNDLRVFESKLTMPSSGLLEGSFVHHLPSSIRDWVIVFGNRVYLPSQKADEKYREIPPGESWSRSSGGVRVSEVRDFLRGVRLVSRERKKGDTLSSPNVQIQSSYNIAGTNPLDILLMVSMYNTAGGEQYVRLQDNYLRRDEVSDAIQLNTAMLIGVTDLPLSELKLDDTVVEPTASQTVVRFFLPVERSSSNETLIEADPKAE